MIQAKGKAMKRFKRGQMVKVKVLGKTFVGSYMRFDRANGEAFGFPHEIGFPDFDFQTQRPRLSGHMFSDKQVSK